MLTNRHRAFVAHYFAAGLLVFAAGAGDPPPPSAPTSSPAPASTQPAGEIPMSFTIRSTAFDPNHAIPRKHTGEGEDLSPALSWSGVPADTKELALICDDPDAPRPQPWVHWVIYKLPATTTGLPEGVARQKTVATLGGALQGLNSWPSENIGYRGPMPPPGHGVHHYHFKLYALDTTLDAQAGWTKEELLKRMKGHILAEAEVVGTYERK